MVRVHFSPPPNLLRWVSVVPWKLHKKTNNKRQREVKFLRSCNLKLVQLALVKDCESYENLFIMCFGLRRRRTIANVWKITLIGQVTKSAGRMPWHQSPMKDVISCDKLRWGANIHRPADFRMGKPTWGKCSCVVNWIHRLTTGDGVNWNI